LEEWIDASKQLAPTGEQNEYLFTGLAPVSSIELIIAPRWMIVLISSAAVLGLVIAWVYVPNVRRSWIVAIVACCIAALSITYPTAALLAAQASVLGIVLAFLAVLLSRLASRRPLTPVSLTMNSSQRMVTPRAESIVMPPVIAAASTAPTASLRVSDSAL
jgi:Mn2+/Fe2+ NRAMP family transporter